MRINDYMFGMQFGCYFFRRSQMFKTAVDATHLYPRLGGLINWTITGLDVVRPNDPV